MSDMLRIGALGDSHGDHEALERALRQMGRLDALCFLGDIAPDADFLGARLALMRRRTALFAVRGNNDFSCPLPGEIVHSFGGKRFLMTHGHLHGVKADLLRLVYHAQAEDADVVLFGHTHRPLSGYERGVLLVNPGAAGGPNAACAVVEIEGERLGVQAFQL